MAIADLTDAIRLDPSDAVNYKNRGLIYERIGDHAKAVADCAEAIRLDPNNAEKYRDVFRKYASQGTAEAPPAPRLSSQTDTQQASDPAVATAKTEQALAAKREKLEQLRTKQEPLLKAYARLWYAPGTPANVKRLDQLRGQIYDLQRDIESLSVQDRKENDARSYPEQWDARDKMRECDRCIDNNDANVMANPESVAYADRAEAYCAKADCARANSDPKFPYDATRDYDNAIADYTEAIRLSPHPSNLYRGRSHVYMQKWHATGNQDDRDKADADEKTANRLAPGEERLLRHQ